MGWLSPFPAIAMRTGVTRLDSKYWPPACARLPRLDLLGEILLQVLLLAVHVGADRAARQAAADRADHRAHRAVLAVGHGADRGADAGADQRAALPVFERTVAESVGAAAGI